MTGTGNNDESGEVPPRFVVVESDRFEADRDRAILSVNRILGPRAAGDWAVKLSRALSDLPGFLGSLSHARDEEASTHYGREVRRLLFYGSARRSGTPVRVLFALLPPASDDSPQTAETVIFLLRLLHGAQSLLRDDPL